MSEVDAEQIVGEWPERLVKILQADIELANEINNRSWSIFTYANRPVFGVSNNTLLYFDPATSTATIQVPAEKLSGESKSWLSEIGVEPGSDLQIPSSVLADLPEELISDHQSYLETLAKYKNNRWKSFREDFLTAFSERLGEDLPVPGYMDEWRRVQEREANKPAPEAKYDSRTTQPTGYWYWTLDSNKPEDAEAASRAIDEGLVRHQYGNVDLDFSQLPAERSQFISQLATLQHSGIGDRAANRFWFFAYGVEVGDWIVLKSEYPAIGQFTGEYRHTESGDLRDVEWHWVSPEPVSKATFNAAIQGRNLWGFTALEPIEFKRILAALGQSDLVDMRHVPEPVEPPQPRPPLAPATVGPRDIGSYFAANGLNYTSTQVADFYTALQTKGFVVLSGISGTGKSKIATGFTELLPNAIHTEVAGPDPVTAQQSLRFKLNLTETWAAVSSDQSHLFPKGDSMSRQDVNFVFEGASYRGSYKIRTLNMGKPTLYLILGGPLSKRLRASAGDEVIYAQFRTAPQDNAFPEIHITLDQPAAATSTMPVETFDVSNTLFLSVRPDWRDSTSLLGYYNPLTQTYEWTDFLRFVLSAVENFRSENPIAWFVILDEMNLAHVEYYFADLLSVLESGRVNAPGHEDFGFTEQPLRLTYPNTVVNEPPPTEVHLPPNLYIIGTVNMDETTHPFSPKVLDRSFTMELTEVDFSDYPRASDAVDSPKLDKDGKVEFLKSFTQNGAYPQIRKDEIREFIGKNEHIRQSLQRLNQELARQRFHFGYRVFDEIVQFLANAEGNGMYDDPIEALDSAVFMKILPKFSGSESRVGKSLKALIAWAQDLFEDGEDGVNLPRTYERAKFMEQVLDADGFVTAF